MPSLDDHAARAGSGPGTAAKIAGWASIPGDPAPERLAVAGSDARLAILVAKPPARAVLTAL